MATGTLNDLPRGLPGGRPTSNWVTILNGWSPVGVGTIKGAPSSSSMVNTAECWAFVSPHSTSRIPAIANICDAGPTSLHPPPRRKRRPSRTSALSARRILARMRSDSIRRWSAKLGLRAETWDLIRHDGGDLCGRWRAGARSDDRAGRRLNAGGGDARPSPVPLEILSSDTAAHVVLRAHVLIWPILLIHNSSVPAGSLVGLRSVDPSPRGSCAKRPRYALARTAPWSASAPR